MDEVHSATESFDVFYGRCWSTVYRAVAVAVDSVDLAQEATDEAMTRAFERWGAVSVMGNPEGWVYRVAVNWARSRLRRLRLSRTKPISTNRAVAFNAVPDPDLVRAIQSLPAHQRDVVVARFLLDMSEKDTATAFGVAVGTIKSRLSRALATLREEL